MPQPQLRLTYWRLSVITNIKTCCVCGSFHKELRNYGLNGAPICFDCAMSTTERRQEAERRFNALLESAEQKGLPLVTKAAIPEDA